MPMQEGIVIIDPVGNASGFGAAKEVFDVMDAGQDYGNSTPGPELARAKEALAVMARAIAKIIPHIQTNALVNTTVAAPIPVTVSLGTGVGGTTAPGAGTGTVA